MYVFKNIHVASLTRDNNVWISGLNVVFELLMQDCDNDQRNPHV